MLIHDFQRCCFDFVNAFCVTFGKALIFMYPSERPLPTLSVNIPELCVHLASFLHLN